MHQSHDNRERRQPSLGNCFGYAAYHPRWMLGNWSAENERQFPVGMGVASGAIPRTATTRPCRGFTQQQETQPVEIDH
jgi:hypothetical protein